jgi:hypothetical protein
MEHFTLANSFGIRRHKDEHYIEIQIDYNKVNINININDKSKQIDIHFIRNYVTQNFSVEMFYYVLYDFLKYNNFKLSSEDDHYTFEGYYTEHYEQSDIIHVKFDV